MVDKRKKINTSNRKTREQIANPLNGLTVRDILPHTEMVDLRENHRIIVLDGGYIKIQVVDESKKYFCPICRKDEYCPAKERMTEACYYQKKDLIENMEAGLK